MSAPQLSVIIPAFNEAESIESTVDMVLAALADPAASELVLVDDGSTDATRELMWALRSRLSTPVVVVERGANGGMGEALRSGFAHATGDVLTWIPGDGEYELSEVLVGLPLLASHDIVFVQRLARVQTARNLLSSCMYLLMRVLFRFDVKDYCGIFVVRRDRFRELPIGSRDVFFTIEVALRAAHAGWATARVSAEWRPRRAGRSKVFNVRTVVRNVLELFRFRWRLFRGR